VFRKLVDRGERVHDAYTSLLELMESQHDWSRATELATEISGSTAIATDENLANNVRLRLAHYACESSAEARAAGYAEEADTLLVAALGHDSRSARANLMSGERALDSGRAADALQHKDQIIKRPSLRALRDWAKDQLDSPRTKERDKVATVVAMLDGVIEDKPAYQCGHCGFRGNVLHWRCPSCGTWDSVSTIIGAEGE